MEINNIVTVQHSYFMTGATKPLSFRIAALQALRKSISAYEQEILKALHTDLGKAPFESYMCEIGLVLDEISHAEKNLAKWMKKHYVSTPLANFAGRSYQIAEPLGVALIMSPWNYPFMLSLDPLIGAIASGCCAVLKPSAYAPHVSAILAKIIEDAFSRDYICVVEGGRTENSELLNQHFDMIFFTGSKDVGKIVMEKAAQHLTPIALELGGKSPCIVDASANLKLAAKRIAFGKFLNCGQTCVAPDYILVHASVKEKLLAYLKEEIARFYGENALACPTWGHIVNKKHFERLLSLMNSGDVVCGGESNAQTRQIAPTILDHVSAASSVMQEEIFGPILPVLPFDTLREVTDFIAARDKPLALYLFAQSKAVEDEIPTACSFGGGCINDTVVHLATAEMPFGGVGESGMGDYHGKASFDIFSHNKSILNKSNWIDLPVRYQPYQARFQKLLRLLLK